MGSAYGALRGTNYYACAAHVRRAACPARRVRVELVDVEVADAALARLVELRLELAKHENDARGLAYCTYSR